MNPPNIVMFIADQLRCDALSCYGNTVCQTPNLDGLAADGVRFEHAYTTSPVCSPSRASLLSGLYAHKHGVMLNTHIKPAFSRGLSPNTPTFSSILKNNGYALDYVGKWHVNADHGPTDFGFDRHIIPRVDWKKGGWRNGIAIEFPRGSQIVSGVSRSPEDECEVSRFSAAGIDMIRQRVVESKPFLIRIDTQQPHFPNVIPEPYASMYDPSSIPPWPNFEEKYVAKPASHVRKNKEWHLEEKDWDWWSQVVAKYYGAVSWIDDCVGRVLEAIHDSGIEEDTIFVFTSDHGDSMGSHRHFEKAGTMYEEVLRVPLLVKMPAEYPAGIIVDSFVRLLDVMPTVVKLGGADLEDRIDGRNMLPIIHGEFPMDWPDSVYCEHHGEVWGYQSQRMVRTLRWKYVYNPHDLDELYDMKNDPAEMRNLAEDEAFKRVLGEMKSRLLGWNDATDDMFQWKWVRWNFPEPVRPDEINSSSLPLTCEGDGVKNITRRKLFIDRSS